MVSSHAAHDFVVGALAGMPTRLTAGKLRCSLSEKEGLHIGSAYIEVRLLTPEQVFDKV